MSLPTCSTVENLGLEDDRRVRVPDGTEQKALGLNRRPNDSDLEARRSEEEALGALRMVQATVADAHGRRANRKGSTGERVGSSTGVMLLGRFIDELVKRGEDLSSQTMKSPSPT